MNAEQIETLYADLGLSAAEDVMCRAMEDVAQRLFTIQDLYARGTPEDLHKALRGLVAVSRQIGLSSIAQIARDVMGCIEDGDAVAQAATLARLCRTGEDSLAELWSTQNLSV